MRHWWCLGLDLGYLITKGCFELPAQWRAVESILSWNDRPVWTVGLSRIYRITLIFGEHGCRDSGWSTGGQISISVQSPHMDGKEHFPLNLVFWEDGRSSCGVHWHKGVTEVKVTCHFSITLLAVGISRGHGDGFAFGGVFCKGALWALHRSGAHSSCICQMDFLAFLLWTVILMSTLWSHWDQVGEQWTAQGDQKWKCVPISYSEADVFSALSFFAVGYQPQWRNIVWSAVQWLVIWSSNSEMVTFLWTSVGDCVSCHTLTVSGFAI